MSTPARPVYLIKSRNTAAQRSHFAIFIPDADSADVKPVKDGAIFSGTKIHVVGAPMAGYQHEIRYSYRPLESDPVDGVTLLGYVSVDIIKGTAVDNGDANASQRCILVDTAERIVAPRKNENFMAPVNDTTNRRCQEWTMDYIRALVQAGILPDSAIDAAQAERDTPEHGILLRKVMSKS